jgi:hypothetical protein
MRTKETSTDENAVETKVKKYINKKNIFCEYGMGDKIKKLE